MSENLQSYGIIFGDMKENLITNTLNQVNEADKMFKQHISSDQKGQDVPMLSI